MGEINNKRVTMLLVFVSIVMQLLGFLREILLAYYFGVSSIVDAYQVAEVVPLIITQVFVSAFPLALIPIILEYKANKIGGREGEEVISSAILGIGTILGIATIVMFLFPQIFVNLIGPGLNNETKILSMSLTRILAPNTFFLSLFALVNAVLGTYKKFVLPALCGLILNTSIITSLILLSGRLGIKSVAYGSAFAGIVMFFSMFIYLNNFRKGLIKTSLFNKKLLLTIVKRVLPVIIGSAMVSINYIVDRSIASLLGIGAIAALTFSYKIVNMPINVFVTSITKITFTDLSIYASQNDIDQAMKKFNNSLKLIYALMVPLSMFLIVLRRPITSFIFGRGQFDTSAVLVTSSCLAIYSIGLFAIAANTLMSMLFYSTHRTKVPLKISIISIIIAACLNITLSRFMSLYGIALGTSLSAIITLIIWYYQINSNFKVQFLKPDSIFVVKNILVSVVTGLIITSVLSLEFMKNLDNFLILAINGSIGVSFLGIFGFIFFNREFNTLLNVNFLKRGQR
ncbi:MAG: murein biosynthesis integral membrane protein MurJ [Clostridia bacterium]|nr:murein biosynthesis integral membrane protein MurJ [Clostridia bacterium]